MGVGMINNNLAQQASAIYRAWFIDYLPFNGLRPHSWKNISFSEIADISSGKRPLVKSSIKTKEHDIPIIGAASVMGYTSKANQIDKILVTGRVGTHGIVQRFNTPCWTSDNTLIIKSIFYEYVFQILQRIDYHAMNRGSTQPLITQGDLKKISVLLPDSKTLQTFESIAGKIMSQYMINKAINVKLTTIRDIILPKLMSFEIDHLEIKL